MIRRQPVPPFQCRYCRKVLFPLEGAIEREAVGYNKCFNCVKEFSAYSYMEQFLDSENVFIQNSFLLHSGFSILSFEENFKKDQVNDLDLSKFGIDEQSKIIMINATPHGSYFPAIFPGNNWSLDISQKNRLKVYPVEIGLESDSSEINKIGFYIIFYNESKKEEFEVLLLEAITFFYNKNYNRMIIPAICAIELRCKLLMKKLNIKRESGIKDKNLIEYITKEINKRKRIIPLKKIFLNNIKRMWGQRDSIAHSGKVIGDYNYASAKKHLLSVIFTLSYLSFLERNLK